jgi:hypothetical protein
MNAIHRTRIHTCGVFGSDARLSNHIGHKGVSLLEISLQLFYYRDAFVTGHSSKNAGGGYSVWRLGPKERQKENGRQRYAASRFNYERSFLAASATVKTSATVEASATVKSAVTVEAASAMEFTATWRPVESSFTADETAAGDHAMSNIPGAAIPGAAPARVTVPRTTVPAIHPAPVSQPSRSVKPWASADEETTGKPIRSVVSVWRTRIRIVSVISVITNRRSGKVTRTNSDANSNPDLRLRIRQRQHQHRQQRNIFQVTHNHLLPRISLNFSWRIPEALSTFPTNMNPERPGKVAQTGVADFSHLG